MSFERLQGSPPTVPAPASVSGSFNSPAAGQKRKRGPRASLACESCRKRKTACDQHQPCAVCQRYSLPCVYREAGAWNIRRSTSSNTYSGLPDGQPRTQALPASSAASSLPPVQPAPAGLNGGFTAVNEFRRRDSQSQSGHNGLPVFVPATPTPQQLRPFPYNETNEYASRPDNTTMVPAAFKTEDSGAPTNVFTFLRGLQTSNGNRSSQAPRPSSRDVSIQMVVRTSVNSASERIILSDQYITRECVRHYFRNAYVLLPVLDENAFLDACETLIWNQEHTLSNVYSSGLGTFKPLFDIVVALGAFIPGEEVSLSRASPELPLKLAKLFYERARTKIAEFTELFSQEIAQAQLLLSFFCHQALKAHSAYRYSGMASSTVSCMDLNDQIRQAAYIHGVDVSQSLHGINTASWSDTPLRQTQPSIPIMQYLPEALRLTHLLRETQSQPNQPMERLDYARKLETAADDWRQLLSPFFDWNHMSLQDPDWLPKQKIALRIRYLHVKLNIHRPFMALAAAASPDDPDMPELSRHVKNCVQVSQEILELVYSTLAHNRFFRTYWYSMIYVFQACMVLIYNALAKPALFRDESLLEDISKGLEIFHAMEKMEISRACAGIIGEVLRSAKEIVELRKTHRVAHPQVDETPNGAPLSSTQLNLATSSLAPGPAVSDVLDPTQKAIDIPSDIELDSLLLLRDTHIALLGSKELFQGTLSEVGTVIQDGDALLEGALAGLENGIH